MLRDISQPLSAVSLTYVVISILVSAVVYAISQKYAKGLNQYPGPFLASITNIWRLVDVWKRGTHFSFPKLHEKHGDVVRVAPNVLSFASPDAIADIYGLNKGFVKSDYYDVFATVNKGNVIYNLFSTRSEEYHAKLRRGVSHAFALSTLMDYEPLVDNCTSFFLRRTQELFADTSKPCNFSRWLQFFAFDVIGEITWSNRLGFVEQNRDVGNIISTVDAFQNYGTVIGQNPWIDRLLMKNPIKLFLESKGLFPSSPNAAIINFALERQREHSKDQENTSEPDLNQQKRGINLLQRFLQSQKKMPDFLTDDRLTAICASLIIAGSDSTAISLSGVFYFLLKNPTVYERLMEEIDAADANGALVSPRDSTGAGDVVPFPAAKKLVYLDAVIMESFRMHPAVSLLLERVTPPQGATICGNSIPGGTVVGCSGWVVHQSKEIFGQDADVYRPERWLESEGADPLRISKMKQSMFQFGAGSRTCVGKNISLMETYKMVPSFLRKFEIELSKPDKPVKLRSAFFVHKVDFHVNIRPRQRVAAMS